MNDTMYLVDNNALIFIGAERRRSVFFGERCRVPQEVAREAGPQNAELLAPLTLPMSAPVLMQVAEVMKTVPVGDRRLLDLYGNKGAADPVLIATAIVLNSPEKPTIFDDEWVIVTNDEGVRVKAAEFDVETVAPAELAALIDAAGTAPN